MWTLNPIFIFKRLLAWEIPSMQETMKETYWNRNARFRILTWSLPSVSFLPPFLFHSTPLHPSLSLPPLSYSGYMCPLSFPRTFTSLTGPAVGIRKMQSSRWLKVHWFMTVGIRIRYPFLCWIQSHTEHMVWQAEPGLGFNPSLLLWLGALMQWTSWPCLQPASPLLAGSAHLQ